MSGTAGGKGTIGVIAYPNVLPFYAGENFAGYTLYHAVPRVLGESLRRGTILAAPVPVVDLWRFRATVDPLDEYGVASFGRVSSVLLFSRVPPNALAGTTVHITDESSTSVRLLWVMMKEYWGIADPAFRRHAGDPDLSPTAVLLIGEKALYHRTPLEAAGYRVYDLAEEWLNWTGLPCVFAQWGVHAGVSRDRRDDIRRCLERGLDRSLPNLDALYDPLRNGAFADASALGTYLRQFTFRFGDAERRAAALFHEKLQTYGLLDGDI